MLDNPKIRFQCPLCDKAVRIPMQHAGKKGTCPGCGGIIRIPMSVTQEAQSCLSAKSKATANPDPVAVLGRGSQPLVICEMCTQLIPEYVGEKYDGLCPECFAEKKQDSAAPGEFPVAKSRESVMQPTTAGGWFVDEMSGAGPDQSLQIQRVRRDRPELSGRSAVAIFFLGLLLLTKIVGIITNSYALSLFNQQRVFLNTVVPEVEKWVSFNPIVQTLAAVPVSIFFCMWVYRAHENLVIFRVRGLRYSHAMAAAAFFIPLVNLVLPFLIVQEIYRASDPRSSPDNWKSARKSRYIIAWWSFCLIAITTTLYGIYIRSLGRGRDLFTYSFYLQDSIPLAMISDFFGLVSIFFLILVVQRITNRQNTKYRIACERENS